MLQDLMAVAYTYAGGRDMPKHLTSAVKPLRNFLSVKDFNLLTSLAPSARPFLKFYDCLLFSLFTYYLVS